MEDQLTEPERLLRQVAQTRREAKSAVAKLNVQRKNYSAKYVKEFLDP